MSSEVATGINILKNGSDPALKKDEELPEWLWELAQPEKPLSDLQRHSFEELSYEEVRSGLVEHLRISTTLVARLKLCVSHRIQQQCRWVKLENRSSIKATNVLKGK